MTGLANVIRSTNLTWMYDNIKRSVMDNNCGINDMDTVVKYALTLLVMDVDEYGVNHADFEAVLSQYGMHSPIACIVLAIAAYLAPHVDSMYEYMLLAIHKRGMGSPREEHTRHEYVLGARDSLRTYCKLCASIARCDEERDLFNNVNKFVGELTALIEDALHDPARFITMRMLPDVDLREPNGVPLALALLNERSCSPTTLYSIMYKTDALRLFKPITSLNYQSSATAAHNGVSMYFTGAAARQLVGMPGVLIAAILCGAENSDADAAWNIFVTLNSPFFEDPSVVLNKQQQVTLCGLCQWRIACNSEVPWERLAVVLTPATYQGVRTLFL